jgi:NADH-quinone oxidoreductase subunit L
MLLIAAFLTAFYMTRQIWLVFFGKARTTPAEHAHDNPLIMTVPLMILAGLSIVGGALNLPFLHNFEHWLAHTLEAGGPAAEAAAPTAEATAGAAHNGLLGFTWGGLDPVVAIGSTLLALAGIALGYYLYARRYPEQQKLPAALRPDDPLRGILGWVFRVFEHKYWVDELYKAVIVDPYVKLAWWLSEVVDWRFWHDFFHDVIIAGGYNLLARLLAVQIDLGGIDRLANGLAEATQRLASSMRRIQTGLVRNYALSVMLGVVLILGYLILR